MSHVAFRYLVDVFMILQPGKIHLLHIAGAAHHRREARLSAGGAASPAAPGGQASPITSKKLAASQTATLQDTC